ncbi:beta-lactamase [Alcanivorax xiamenensis]|uniref:Beta-lactamase n=2 Tax=Alcanivorax TaxID=59753 RepID=A0ABQ6Y4W2_9GAMM|nr:class A beta-lactamase [Alcanivorax xiamenensis]KAF0804069.1 beta-lactamase [Alcanivorax xiamenensis]
MNAGLSRRGFLLGSMLALPAMGLAAKATDHGKVSDLLSRRCQEWEHRHGGRVGVAVWNLATGYRAGHRVDERFLMCSTFKALAAALVLARVDRGEESLDRRLLVSREDLVGWSPVTGKRTGEGGMTVAELCEAAVAWSDNGAANLLIKSFGGPGALTDFLRESGDPVTRLDRLEPELNGYGGPDGEYDTTSPAAMLETLHRLLFGEVLSAHGRAQLAAWMIANKTGDRRLRAGFPDGWLVADKTGTSGDELGYGNDIGVAWSRDRGAILVTVYCEMPKAEAGARDRIIAEVAEMVSKG